MGQTRDDDAGERPGDKTTPGVPGSAEALCPACSGRGEVDGSKCESCGGTGKVLEGIGGA